MKSNNKEELLELGLLAGYHSLPLPLLCYLSDQLSQRDVPSAASHKGFLSLVLVPVLIGQMIHQLDVWSGRTNRLSDIHVWIIINLLSLLLFLWCRRVQ